MTTTVSTADDVRRLVGRDLGATDWIEVTQERVDLFAEAGDDHHWVHVDPERAADGPFGGTIAQGSLTLALTVPLLARLLRIENGETMYYGLNRVRFPAPVPVGARVRLTGRVAEVTDVALGGLQLTLDFTVEIEGSSKPGCVAQSVWRYYPASTVTAESASR
jgi:acyl dehydratase